MKKKTKKLKAIKRLLDNHSGMKSEPYGNRTRKTISIEVSNIEGILRCGSWIIIKKRNTVLLKRY